MFKWLLVTAAAAGAFTSPAQAQLKGLAPSEVGSLARTRAVDFRIAQERGVPPPHGLPLGMLVSRELAPNTALGIGLTSSYGRRSAGADPRIGNAPRRSRKPAITFVMRF